MRSLAIIPARGGSKGIPRKNIIDLNGKPLIVWSILQALNSKVIDYVHVSTDDRDIADIAIANGANCTFLRPDQLAGDLIGTGGAILHAINLLSKKGLNFDIVVELQPTYCFRGSQLIIQCLAELKRTWTTTDSILTCEKIQDTSHPDYIMSLRNDEYLNFGKKLPDQFARQNLEDSFACRGVVLTTKIDSYLKTKTFFSSRSKAHVIEDRFRLLDINDKLDLEVANAISKIYPWLLD
jgi:CMP-N-acetylneuraminic acid synthetase